MADRPSWLLPALGLGAVAVGLYLTRGVGAPGAPIPFVPLPPTPPPPAPQPIVDTIVAPIAPGTPFGQAPADVFAIQAGLYSAALSNFAPTGLLDGGTQAAIDAMYRTMHRVFVAAPSLAQALSAVTEYARANGWRRALPVSLPQLAIDIVNERAHAVAPDFYLQARAV